MSELVLQLADEPDFDLDLSEVLPERIAGASLDAIKRTRLLHGKRRVALGDLFEVDGAPGDTIAFRGATARLRRIGHGMTSGTILVAGHAGDELGAGMTGGDIRVHGNADDYVGSGMRGGIIAISGRTGDFTGGALPDSALGMRNGVICVGKNTGERTGDRMRRGLLVVNGDAGRYCGSNMIAGTIIVTGQTAVGVGVGMRRGSIVLLKEPSEIPATFNDCGSYSLAIVALLSRYLRSVNRTAYSRLRSVRDVRRFAGDIGCDGQGELLIAVR
jgi:formylmethanofuran dehydrogenase subunit C